MIVLVGASASGKTELAKILYQSYGYQKCVTTTTRLPRPNEQNGLDYHFVDKKTFLTLESNNAFLEVTYYQDNKYGIQKKDVNTKGIVIVDPDGANALIEQLDKDAFLVYVEASESLRIHRMKTRGDSEDLIQKRLKFDRDTFNINRFKNIDLLIRNESESLEKLAQKIHTAYQKYLDASDLS